MMDGNLQAKDRQKISLTYLKSGPSSPAVTIDCWFKSLTDVGMVVYLSDPNTGYQTTKRTIFRAYVISFDITY